MKGLRVNSSSVGSTGPAFDNQLHWCLCLWLHIPSDARELTAAVVDKGMNTTSPAAAFLCPDRVFIPDHIMLLSRTVPQAYVRGQQYPARAAIQQNCSGHKKQHNQHAAACNGPITTFSSLSVRRRGSQLHAAPPDGPIMSQDQVMSDPANAMLRPEDDQKPLVEQVEEERAEEDRETFITESGLVEEVEEEDAKVCVVLVVWAAAAGAVGAC